MELLVRRLLSLELSEFIASLCCRYRCCRIAILSKVAAVVLLIFSIVTEVGRLIESKTDIFCSGCSTGCFTNPFVLVDLGPITHRKYWYIFTSTNEYVRLLGISGNGLEL